MTEEPNCDHGPWAAASEPFSLEPCDAYCTKCFWIPNQNRFYQDTVVYEGSRIVGNVITVKMCECGYLNIMRYRFCRGCHPIGRLFQRFNRGKMQFKFWWFYLTNYYFRRIWKYLKKIIYKGMRT